jgi:hypothetical protein
MPVWIQHLLVAMIALACIVFVARQAFKTLTLRRGKLGACCAKGCDAAAEQQKKIPADEQRVQFMPVELLSRKR